jgi:hypothetical protein
MYLRLHHRNLVRGVMAIVPQLSGNLYVFLIKYITNLNSWETSFNFGMKDLEKD